MWQRVLLYAVTDISEKLLFYPEDVGGKFLQEDSSLERHLFKQDPSALNEILDNTDFLFRC
jgi:hypothetical protein